MPYSGPAAPPTVEISVVATSFRTSPGVDAGRQVVELGEHGREAAVHVLAVVAVADLAVERDELDPVLGDDVGAQP